MMTTHVTRPGECFATIARDHGYAEKDLYGHPDNAELKKLRPNAHMLNPGDVVSLPDKGPLRRVTAQVEMKNRFVVKLPTRELKVRLLDSKGKPIANETYAITIGDDLRSGQTDGDGYVVQTFQRRARVATIRILDRTIALSFGELDPLKDVPDSGASGARERLRNLGYDVGEDGAGDEDLDHGTRTALALFQHHAALEVTGTLDDATTAKLIELHGC
jgi:hypothetical protein